MWTELTALRDALAAISDVKTCKIGIEGNLSPSDYPMIRLVPERLLPGKYTDRTVEVGIYFGMNITDSEGLETVYEGLATMEDDIIATLKENKARYIETITDEDRLDAFKLMFIRCEIGATRPNPQA